MLLKLSRLAQLYLSRKAFKLLFSICIKNTIELVKAASQAINPNAFLRLEIKANKEGSFETVIDAVVKCTSDLFAKENIKLAGTIISGFVGILTIKKHLGGKKAKMLSTRTTRLLLQTKITNLLQYPLLSIIIMVILME